MDNFQEKWQSMRNITDEERKDFLKTIISQQVRADDMAILKYREFTRNNFPSTNFCNILLRH